MIARHRLILWILFISLLALLYVIAKERLNHYQNQWVLTWSDEFDSPVLDVSGLCRWTMDALVFKIFRSISGCMTKR